MEEVINKEELKKFEIGLDYLNPMAQEELAKKFATEPPKSVTDDNVAADDKIEIIKKQEEITDPPQKSLNSSPYVPLLAKHFAEEGLLSEQYLKEIEEDGTLETFTEAFGKQLRDLAESNVSKYSPEIQEFIKMSEAGVSKEIAKELTNRSIELSKITDDLLENDISIQEKVTRDYLKTLNVSDDEIEEQLEYFKDTDKLYAKSLAFRDKLNDYNNKQASIEKAKAIAQKEQQSQENQKVLSDLRLNIENKTEIIPGIKVSKGVKEAIFKNLTTPVDLDKEGNPITFVQSIRNKNPIEFEIMLNYLAHEGVFNGKFDSLIKGTKSKTVEELEKTLSKTNIFDSGNATLISENNRNLNKDITKEIASSIPMNFNDLFEKK